MNTAPLVSIVLPVYNCEQYIEEAVSSILNQTFRDFELIIINDGSTDQTAAKLEKINDVRLRVINRTNKGLPTTLNELIYLSRGKYIARQDADDISLPDRLQKQISFLEGNPDYAMVGSHSIIWLEDTPTDRGHFHPVSNKDIKLFLYLDSPFVHSSVVFRKDTVEKLNGYSVDPKRQPEDYELWLRISYSEKMANLPEQLIVYREVKGSLSRINCDPFPYIHEISAEHIKNMIPILPKSLCLYFAAAYRRRQIKKGRIGALKIALVAGAIVLRQRHINSHFKSNVKNMIRYALQTP